MDLCVGVTVGSAVQIALFVLPGSVLIGWAMDRSMSLFFRYAYCATSCIDLLNVLTNCLLILGASKPAVLSSVSYLLLLFYKEAQLTGWVSQSNIP
jgi:calcium/proton exchanger cax